MKVVVDQCDIDGATPGIHTCPVARAVRRQGYPNAKVGWRTCGLDGIWGGALCLIMPGEVTKRIKEWDVSGEMEPFTFPLEVPK